MKNTASNTIPCTLIKYIIPILSLIVLQNSAWSQGFSVKPMQIPITARAGGTVEQRIDIGSTRATGNTTVKLYPSMVSQDAQGIQYEVDPKDIQKMSDYQKSRSCAGWITLDKQTLVIGPMETKSVIAKFKIPQKARGFYYAGITAVEEQAGRGSLAINVRWVFLPTVLLTVQGPPASRKFHLLSLICN